MTDEEFMRRTFGQLMYSWEVDQHCHPDEDLLEEWKKRGFDWMTWGEEAADETA